MNNSGSEHDDRRDGSRSDDAAFETPAPEKVDRGDGDDRPMVPEGVLHGIDDIMEGRTADVDDIEAVLED